MKAQIKKKTDTGFGVLVTDNNSIEHKIGVRYDGEIDGHLQDSYPDDPDDRTKAGNEHVNQARRFAKYWVYRKRGYDTLAGWQNPDRIELAAIALNTLSSDAAEQYLGDLFGQLRSLYLDVDPSVDVPEGVDPSDAVHQQDIYLGMDGEKASTHASVLGELETSDLDTDPKALAAGTEVDSDTLSMHDEGLFIEATSGVHVRWDDAMGEYHTQWGTQPAVDRDPDARIELLAFEPESITELKRQAVRNLLCQVRDCYLAMGIAPPERFQLLGHGRHDASTWYVHNEFYEDYYDPDAEVNTWFVQHTPENAYSTAVGAETAAQTNE